ncbi:MAG: class I SAM-dependent methyltransferase [Actinomycetota bacterium]
MPEETYYEKAYDLTEDETRDFYAKWAATYDEELVDGNGYIQPERCGDAMERFVVDRSARVLDMGCGTGLAGAVLHGRGYTAVDGCDYSPEMLAEARKTGAYGSLFEIDLNDHPLPIDADAYDVVVAVGVFSFGHVDASVLDEVVRFLPASGVLVICVNEVWWDEGSLAAKVDELEAAGSITIELRELGPHVPSHDVDGWVIVARVS